MPGSALAARMARACRSASASRRSGWSESLLEVLADERGQTIDPDKGQQLARPGAPARRPWRARVPRQGRNCGAVLRALGLDGADTDDRRRAIGVEIPLWLQRCLVADPDHP